ncbi:hypothetical protein AMAG_19198 [Allomyces macrogynus ATCC 38327]|uniref:Uncharacterized protein n=1 Tax=Allomyces macrogynus (strain ATCC 38327) TaxID=578462 RepID=A0A0L0STS4_ALLM3|nr:hypothetical protein AMAG_19198 [Allomyces macrogynus ATCC 38327]|eukprot:KNE65719.1 hypothetical protein AMAG_19198 [Allomyces macrogynus ATCC 38327]
MCNEVIDEMVQLTRRERGPRHVRANQAPPAPAEPPAARGTGLFDGNDEMFSDLEDDPTPSSPDGDADDSDRALRTEMECEFERFYNYVEPFRNRRAKQNEPFDPNVTREWWRQHEKQFPHVGLFARHAFSLAGRINTKIRAHKIGYDTSHALVVGMSLRTTCAAMGLDPDNAQVALCGMRSARGSAASQQGASAAQGSGDADPSQDEAAKLQEAQLIEEADLLELMTEVLLLAERRDVLEQCADNDNEDVEDFVTDPLTWFA